MSYWNVFIYLIIHLFVWQKDIKKKQTMGLFL